MYLMATLPCVSAMFFLLGDNFDEFTVTSLDVKNPSLKGSTVKGKNLLLR